MGNIQQPMVCGRSGGKHQEVAIVCIEAPDQRHDGVRCFSCAAHRRDFMQTGRPSDTAVGSIRLRESLKHALGHHEVFVTQAYQCFVCMDAEGMLKGSRFLVVLEIDRAVSVLGPHIPRPHQHMLKHRKIVAAVDAYSAAGP
jgi:hypothetical protein